MAGADTQPGVIRYRLTPEAENDLFEIWQYIAQDSLKSANRVEKRHLRRVRTVV